MTDGRFESFRDPDGKVIVTDSDVWRLVNPDSVAKLDEFLKVRDEFRLNGQIVETFAATPEEHRDVAARLNGSTPAAYRLFRHPRIEFPSFPYEWSPQMLYDSAELTIEIAVALAERGWGIKDATPFNILFDGAKPVFVDVLSFEKRRPTDPIWLAYNQFVNTFLIPLLVNKELRLSLKKIFTTDRDGCSVSSAAELFGSLQKLRPAVFSLVTLPKLLSGKASKAGELYKPKDLNSAETAAFVLRQNLRRLRKQLKRVAPRAANRSDWTQYTEFNQETIPDYMRAKRDFVTATVDELKPKSVLDVGCNTGMFSMLAARYGAAVVAIDHDEAVVDRVYRNAKEEGLNILPLVLSLSQPTPRLGWRYSENPSFLDRALGRFDLVLMLAVVHHMLVHDRIPLREIFRLAADLTKDALIVEFVPRTDEMFKSLARGRDDLHRDFAEESFVNAAKEFFDIVRRSALPDTERILYLMRRK